jgi:hypothetical protein
MDRQMENRRLKRTRTYHPAKVLVQDEAVHHCTVHNLTGFGLCIELTFEADELPDTFDFSFDNFKTVHVCKTIWREDNVAGVTFERPPQGSPGSRRAKLRVVK